MVQAFRGPGGSTIVYWIELPQWRQNVSSAKPLVLPMDWENVLRQSGHAMVTHVADEPL
jgi:hypothetical protein